MPVVVHYTVANIKTIFLLGAQSLAIPPVIEWSRSVDIFTCKMAKLMTD